MSAIDPKTKKKTIIDTDPGIVLCARSSSLSDLVMKPKPSSSKPKPKPRNGNVHEERQYLKAEAGGLCVGTFVSHKYNHSSSSSRCSKTSLHPKKNKPLPSNSKDKDKENLIYINLKLAKTVKKSQKPIPRKNPKKPLSPCHSNSIITTPLHNQSQSQSQSQSQGDECKSTPPIQASVSPELIIESKTTTPASTCYGAGHVHVLSGVSDKRKCRPTGLLLAAPTANNLNNCKLSSSSSSSSSSFSSSYCLFPPLPAQASMHWLSSPSTETLSVLSSTSIETTTTTTEHISINSPAAQTHFHESLELEDLLPSFSFKACHLNSPFSTDSDPHSLGSGNVICTPESDNTCATYAKKNKVDSQLITSLADALQISTLMSPNTVEPPIKDKNNETDSIAFSSFQFDSITASCSTLGNERLSWREEQGLISEMDEFDCCVCLSDDDHNGNYSDDLFQFFEASNNVHDAAKSDSCSPKNILGKETRVEEKTGQELENYPSGGSPQLSSSCAESISIDEGRLLTSADSDWDLCFKKDLFRL